MTALPPKREVVQTINDEESLLHVRLSQATLHKLDRLKSLRAHKNPRMTYSELIDDMCDYMLKKLDPTVSGPSARATRTNQTAAKTSASSSDNPRYISTQLKQKIWSRDRGQCTYHDAATNRRCESRHLLQIDHIKPVCDGGLATEENLRLLCHAHHRLRDEVNF